MTTLEDATARTQAVIEALDEAATRMTACGDYLDSITAQLDALGTYGRAREASATRDGADQALAKIAAMREAVGDLRLRILDLRGSSAASMTPGTGSPVPLPTTAVMDPAFDKGALGDRFATGVFRREEFRKEHERSTTDYLAERLGWSVFARREVQGQGVKNPDAMVRRDREDPGTVTEFKRLDSPSFNAARRHIWEAAEQVNYRGGGDAVIDARKVGLTEQVARQHVGDAVGEADRKGKAMPARIHVILGDGSMITIQGRE